MIVVLLGGKEWVLRHSPRDVSVQHYTQRRRAAGHHDQRWRVVTLCEGSDLGADARPANADVTSDDICPRCWREAMRRSSEEAKREAARIWGKTATS